MSSGTTGCYLGHVAAGQMRLLRASTPIEDVLAASDTTPELREQLTLVRDARAFSDELGLDVGDQYTTFASWPGDRIVTSVVATEPGAVEPRGFWFPIVGRVPYKGFFDRELAAKEAARLREAGLDTCEVAVSAYSTLGWFPDPVTGPMLRRGGGRLVETVVHELVHATVFVASEADFNEGVAKFIGEEGAVLYYTREGREDEAERQRARVEDRRTVNAVLSGFRDQVEALYESEPAGRDRDARRAALEEETRERVAGLSFLGRDAERTAGRLRLNDACLALAATYTRYTHPLAERFDAMGNDLPAFIAAVVEAADTEDPIAHLLGP